MKNIKTFILIPILLIVIGAFYFYEKKNNFENYGCDKFQSNAEMLGCLRDLKNDLLKEREMVFNDYLKLESPRVDPNFMIPLADVKEKTASWYKSTDGYRKAHCEARVANYADGSGYFEGIEMCEIELIRQDTKFLRERIKELENYSKDLTPESMSG